MQERRQDDRRMSCQDMREEIARIERRQADRRAERGPFAAPADWHERNAQIAREARIAETTRDHEAITKAAEQERDEAAGGTLASLAAWMDSQADEVNAWDVESADALLEVRSVLHECARQVRRVTGEIAHALDARADDAQSWLPAEDGYTTEAASLNATAEASRYAARVVDGGLAIPRDVNAERLDTIAQLVALGSDNENREASNACDVVEWIGTHLEGWGVEIPRAGENENEDYTFTYADGTVR